MALENRLEFLTPGTAPTDCAWSVRFGIKHGMTRATASPLYGSDLQHSTSNHTAPVRRRGSEDVILRSPASQVSQKQHSLRSSGCSLRFLARRRAKAIVELIKKNTSRPRRSWCFS